MQLAIVEARTLLSVLVILRGRVSLMSPVFFFGRRKSSPSLKPGGGGRPLHMALRTANSTLALASGQALQAAKEMPSGPEQVFFGERIEARTSSRVGLMRRLSSTVLL